ncbi:MAG: hypothetical protein LBC61_06410, partial [Candidatus Peribacteria bacterium]|nr:hypothetical protein [Candidatus Peribacteria bacterium]
VSKFLPFCHISKGDSFDSTFIKNISSPSLITSKESISIHSFSKKTLDKLCISSNIFFLLILNYVLD